MKIKHAIFLFALFIGLSLNSQEGLRPLSANLTRNFQEKPVSEIPSRFNATSRTQAISIQLPFKDDFFYAYSSQYAAPWLWEDSTVYINTGYPIAPPSLGVATFDGLDRHGYPHDKTKTNLNGSYPADTLTSRSINLYVSGTQTLLPSDSVALIFYYQLRGNGDNPETGDSLIVDLYNPTQGEWISNVWYHLGNANSNTNDTSFKRAFIRIDSSFFFRDGFRFRFRNKATVSGDFDHWHIDYVQLDKGLYAAPPVYDDVAFAYVPTSLIMDYSAMPWRQYKASEMTDLMRVWIKNNSNIVRYIQYKHTVYDKDNNAVSVYNGGAANLSPFADSGYSKIPQHAYINVSQHYSLSLLSDTMDYRIEHVLTRTQGGSGDFAPRNDTVEQYQRFRNYYAYDDGSAEAGYYVNGVGSMMAIRIRLFEPDTFRSMRIYFDPVGNINEAEGFGFRINVWAAQVNSPGAIQYSLETVYRQRFLQSGFKSFPEYELSTPIPMQAGTYYIGIQQQGTSTVTVGFDRNYDNRGATYFNTGSGWQQSSIKGSLLMRPVFGAKRIPVGLAEFDETKLPFRIYPNPAAGQFVIESQEGVSYEYTVSDALGSSQLRGAGEGTLSVDTRSLSAGIYFVTLYDKLGRTSTQKLLISR